ncbi:MAG TPA: signal peptidase II [Candidatus Binataceae bacterium]|nr:signal peptidase II [Candidatus Binataceae bacterium]
MMLALVALPVFVLDQLAKLYIVRHFKLFEQIDLVPHWLAITYTLNSGAAFSLFATLPPAVRGLMLDGLAGAAVVVLGVLLARGARSPVVSAAFALIMGGAAGNLFDRVVRGCVVDFIYVHYYAWSYPVFNIADSAITVGVAIILIHSIFSHDTEG